MPGGLLQLLPALDVTGGRVARLRGERAERGRSLGDPVELALSWQAAGAAWLHLVDLDAALGRGSNAELLAAVVGALDIDVELSGGVRDQDSLTAALATGCRRAVLGTAALEDLAWCSRAVARYGDRVAVGLDVRDGLTLAARGVDREVGDLPAVLTMLEGAGCHRYVVTDVDRDGTLAGPNLDLLRAVCARTRAPVIASGGVSGLDDLRALSALVPAGVEGAIVGSALHTGAFTLAAALAVVSAGGPA
ncbi:MAG TPA: HisA/HisF-related TIM barrel protein [Nocardioidaceae bacterium]|nr:HisA/HisF-related TIM barrel protein [Nocardioidaceae bacterium]